MRKLAIAVIAVLALAGCGTESEPHPTDAEKSAQVEDLLGYEPIDATWPSGRYADDLQERLQLAYNDKDCDYLQEQFDTAAERAGAADLMTYIDAALKGADCY